MPSNFGAGENFWESLGQHRTSLVAQTVKRLPTMRETWVQSLGWEDLLEKEMATHSSILAWKIPWTEEPGRLQSMGSQRVGHNWATSLSLLDSMEIKLAILKESNPEYSLERRMLKLKLQYFGHLMWRTDSLEKTLMLGKIEGRETLKALKWIRPKSWESRHYFWFLSFPLPLYSIHQQVELCLPPRYNLNLSASPQLHCCHPDPASTISAVLCST